MSEKIPHILAYDTDRLLDNVLKEFSIIFNFAYSFEDDLGVLAKKISSNEFDALILVEKEHPEKLFQFLQSIKSPIPIGYFAKFSRDGVSFSKLRKELHVDYVLEQPVDKNEAAALFRKFFSKSNGNEPKVEYLTPELLAKYNEKIYEKIERIESLIKETALATDYKANLLEIRNEIHKISGNAAPYGYPEAGKLCSGHEMFLYNIYSGGTQKKEIAEIVLQNELFFRKLKLYFQKLTPRYKESEPAAQVILPKRQTDKLEEGVLIHLITTDFDLARYFQGAAAKKNINLLIEDNPDTYIHNFSNLAKLPQIILVEENFPFLKWNGINLIKAILSEQKENRVSLVGILTEWDNLDKRLEWMKEGVDFVVKKPVTDQNVEYILNHALGQKARAPLKILILDDDEEQGLLMKNILESQQMSAQYVQDEAKLFMALEEYVPDLLLLDVQMPKYGGKLLLSALREDIRFKNMVIVIVTALSAAEIDEWAYKANCDAIIHKPINAPIFLARIVALLERQRTLYSYQETDSLTGLLVWDSFFHQAEDFVSQCPIGTKCAFVLLKIENWENLANFLTPSEAQQILLIFSELIKSHFYSGIIKGILVKSCFAFLFKDLSGGEIEFLMESFYDKIRKKVWLSTQTQLKIVTCSSAVLFVTGDATIKEAVDEGRAALAQALKGGSSKIEIRRVGKRVTLPTQKKRVILVDDDVDLTDIVQFAFEKHGIQVSTFHKAADALHYFAQLPSLEEGTLIILDRRLPDGDGIDILRKIHDKFPGKIKAIFLSSLSSEKEILESLRAGAVDYMTKPFSIEVLLEKASILLSG